MKYKHILSFKNSNCYEQFIIWANEKILTIEQWNNLVREKFGKTTDWILINHTVVKK